MLARLWRREVEAVVEPPPLLQEQPSPHAALLESHQTPELDSLEEPLQRAKQRRRPLDAPIVRIWLLDRETPPPPKRTSRDHAARLLRWVRENGFSGKLVLAMDLQKIYPVMCEQLDWETHRWQPVACELRKLTGNRKCYRWVDGHRRRVYLIKALSVQDVCTGHTRAEVIFDLSLGAGYRI